jgi:N-acetylmuramoyl-L-alanine amidase
MIKLCFDYGHGGTDPGAVYNGRKEAADVLSLGREVAEEIRRHGINVDETRTADVTVGLTQRSAFANQQNYNYFISFHRNAFKPETGTGAETYTYMNASEKTISLATKIQKALVEAGFKDRGVKTGNFHVLRKTKAPAVLIEIGFIDNSQDNVLFDIHKKAIVTGISKAILSHLGIKYIEETECEKDDLTEALDLLISKGIINSPDYWQKNARSGKVVKGEYAGLLIERMAEYISPQKS